MAENTGRTTKKRTLGEALLDFLEHPECEPSLNVQAPKVPSIECEVSTKAPLLDVKVLGARFSSHRSHCLAFSADILTSLSVSIHLSQ